MDTVLRDLNTSYALARVGSEWVSCTLTGSNLYTTKTNERVCSRKEKTKWKHFREASRYKSKEALGIDDKVYISDDEGETSSTYQVIDIGGSSQGETEYLIGR